MNTFRGTNPQRHPWFVQDIDPPILPPECRVVHARPDPLDELLTPEGRAKLEADVNEALDRYYVRGTE